MSHHPRWTVFAAATLAIGLALAGATGAGFHAQGRVAASPFIEIGSAVPAAIQSGQARPSAKVHPARRLLIGLGLPLRHQRRLHWMILHDAAFGHYLTKAQFDREFAPTAAHAARIISWAKANGLRIAYASPDHLVITVRGGTAHIEHLMRVHIAGYNIHGALVYANSDAPRVPRSLGIQTITGLDDIRHAVRTISRVQARRNDIPPGGLTPQAIRTAYDMNGYTVNSSAIDGTGQTVGITGFGETVPDSDFKLFAEHVGGPEICTTCADKISWVQLYGKVTDDPNIDEQALDVEYVHGLAPHVHVKYWLGGDGSDPAMQAAVAAAASDPTVHVVSNSWGDPGPESASGNNSFVLATQNSFEEAVMTGTTFYFSTGDNASDSGCADANGNVYSCGLPSYPADSPYVVAVGGTNLQLNPALTAWSSETVWNRTSSDWGSGGGCASFLRRPSWQTGVQSATCPGRAIPDISAAGDADHSPVIVWDNGSGFGVGGTSVAATLISGMAIDTNSYLTLEHGLNSSIPPPSTGTMCNTPSQTPPNFCWMGWTGPEIYRLAQSSAYSSDFHDVLCGSNTWPARQGWDQATGWGSLDWYNYSRSFAGFSVPPSNPPPSWLCNPGLSGSTLNGISCNPAYHCHAVGQRGTLLSATDGWRWITPKTSGASGNITAISCPSIKVCFAAAANGWIHKTTNGGKTFSSFRLGVRLASSISCLSTTTCVVVGNGIATTKNGRRFAKRSDPVTTPLVSVSCVSRSCTAITASGRLVQSVDQIHWQIVSPATPAGGSLASVSCAAANVCVAVGRANTPNSFGGTALVYSTSNGTTWTPQTLGGTGGPLSGVSCASTLVCDAVGGNGLVVRTINGTDWAPVAVSVPRSQLNGISCPTIGLCFTAGASGRVLQIGASTGH